jgi:hypothetical protein
MVQKVKVLKTNSGIHIKMDEYIRYVERELNHFPQGAAKLCWPIELNYDWNGKYFRHDSVILSIDVREQSKSSQADHLHEVALQMHLQMRNDAYMHVKYIGVKRYLIRKKKTEWPPRSQEHGSVIIDEVRLGREGAVIHEWICHDARIFIECDDIEASFEEK